VRWAARPWWERWPIELAVLEAGVPPWYNGFERVAIGPALVYRGEVEVDTVGTRRIAIIFPGRPSRVSPIVVADGPRRSRHRYLWPRMTSLCLWYPRDPEANRWTVNDRLAALIDLVRAHLVKESYWRTHGIWPAPEVHASVKDPDEASRRTGSAWIGRSRRLRAARRRCWCGSARYSACHGALPAEQELTALGIGD
jgi:hypothetical protein